MSDFPATAREIHLVSRPVGEPKPSDFAMVDAPLTTPEQGQLVVRNSWLSVDPYMRGRMNEARSYIPPFRLGAAMEGGAVGVVVASMDESFPVGTTVRHGLGWREYATVDAAEADAVDVQKAPATAYLGVLGMTGLTAYVGLKEIAPVREGDVVFISGAAGAVGIVAARVARALGASLVVGSAGGSKKAESLKDFGYDAAIDYRSGSIKGQLKVAAPEGIDVYFDNVGGEHLAAALLAMKTFGRVALCGAIAQYNAEVPPPGPNLMSAVGKRITLRGFLVFDHEPLRDEYVEQAAGWLAEGSLIQRETHAYGLENAVDAFLGMLAGRNTGKMLVSVAEES